MSKIRTFENGATRDTEDGKLDFDGFFSPLSMFAYAEYLHGHRIQPDGTVRDSDNWQKGIPLKVYAKSLWRHQMDFWALHRGYFVYKERMNGSERTHIRINEITNLPKGWRQVTKEESLCGIIFNSNGYLHEQIKKAQKNSTTEESKKCTCGGKCKGENNV